MISYKCDICGRAYKVARSLWRHRKYECQKEPGVFCNICPYKTKYKASLSKHYLCVHPGVDSKFYR